MNYIQLINQFWRLDAERPFQSSDTRLYFYLLYTCNNLGWKNPFGHSDRHLALQVGVCVNTVRRAKNRLQEVGLVKITSPDKPSIGINGQSLFTLLTVSKNDTVYQSTVSNIAMVPATVPAMVPAMVPATNNKQNKTKQNISISENIKNDFTVLAVEVLPTYHSISKMEQQMTLNQYNTLRTELKMTPDQVDCFLQRMDNYKPLLKKYVSVYLTLRQWFNREIKSNSAANNSVTPQFYGR